jgi:hypothetical protein
MNQIDQAKAIITSGLYQDNLLRLVPLCDQLIPTEPVLWFILKSIFSSLETEYDNQAISSKRYEEVENLIPKLINAIDDPSIYNLNALINDFSFRNS